MTDSPQPAPAEQHAPPGFLLWVTQLVHQHRQPLVHYARHHGLTAEQALDAVQDSFLSFLRLPEAREIAKSTKDSRKMLTVMVRHNLQNALRKQRRTERAEAMLTHLAEANKSELTTETLVANAEELARVHGCILRMAKLQRSVVTLSLLDEQPNEDVALTLGITPGYARVLLHRARAHIEQCDYVYDDLNNDNSESA